MGNTKRTEEMAYRDMQQGFTENTRVITLSGIRNSLLTINTSVPNTFKPHPACMMINSGMSTRKASDKTNLFFKVSNSTNGVMELWLHKWHFVEAKAWASTALQQIAQLSGIDPSSQKSLAEARFKTPSKVWGRMHELTEDSALPVQRALFMDFSPVPATKSAEKKQPAKAPTKK